MRTGVNTNRKVFRHSSPTLGAELRGVSGRNLNYFSSSLRRFEAKYVEELKPSHIPHRPVEAMPAIPRVHLFNEDGIVISKELVSNLEVKISPLVSYFLVGFGNQYSGFPPSVRAFDPTGKPLLSHSQDILRLLKEAGVFYLLTIRGGQERLKPNVDANCLANFRQGLLRHILTGEADVPFACRASPDGYCLYITFNGARETELKSAYVSDKKVFAIKPPACLLQSEAVIPVSAFEARKAGLFTILKTAKEASIGFVQTLKHVLENLRASLSIFREDGFKLRELLNLVEAGYRTLVLAIDGDALLKGSIVEPSAKSEPIVGFLECLRIRLKAILEGLFHLLCTMFNIAYSREGDKPCRASLSVSPL